MLIKLIKDKKLIIDHTGINNQFINLLPINILL
jgi:hypothetical protein